jgi:hypothetical protein
LEFRVWNQNGSSTSRTAHTEEIKDQQRVGGRKIKWTGGGIEKIERKFGSACAKWKQEDKRWRPRLFGAERRTRRQNPKRENPIPGRVPASERAEALAETERERLSGNTVLVTKTTWKERNSRAATVCFTGWTDLVRAHSQTNTKAQAKKIPWQSIRRTEQKGRGTKHKAWAVAHNIFFILIFLIIILEMNPGEIFFSKSDSF